MAVSITYTEKEILTKVQPDAEYSAKYNPLSGWVITGRYVFSCDKAW